LPKRQASEYFDAVERPDTEIIAGKYRLLRKLGQGGMGSVWYAEHLTLHSPVAIKLIDLAIVANPEALARFLREAQSAAKLRSPHVVQILDHGVDNGTPYIAMELLEGESLADRLARVGKLSPADTARIMTHVARAVARAHEAGIVHRDLKPDNIFIVQNDDEEIAKVLDFGIAKATSSVHEAVSSSTRTGAVLGTPYYMSPEQAEGAKTLDHRSDIWALGVIAFECLLGRRPFDAETLAGLLLAICTREIPVPSQLGLVPAGFDGWFQRACARDVEQRFSSAKEAVAELKRLCTGAAAEPPVSDGARVFGGAMPDSVVAPAVSAAGRSASGLSSTNQGATLPAARKSRAGVVLGVAVLLAAGGGVLAWRLGATALSASAASASLLSSTPPTVAPSPVVVPEPAPPIDAPAKIALPAEVASAAPPAALVRPGAPATPAHRSAPKPALVPAPASPQRPAPTQPAPATAPASKGVNLGI
jgi:serine/threonine-protein kinase